MFFSFFAGLQPSFSWSLEQAKLPVSQKIAAGPVANHTCRSIEYRLRLEKGHCNPPSNTHGDDGFAFCSNDLRGPEFGIIQCKSSRTFIIECKDWNKNCPRKRKDKVHYKMEGPTSSFPKWVNYKPWFCNCSALIGDCQNWQPKDGHRHSV